MATVYLARDRQHDALVAVKVLHPELAPRFAGERFAREIRITGRAAAPERRAGARFGETPAACRSTQCRSSKASRSPRDSRANVSCPIDDALRIAISVAECARATRTTAASSTATSSRRTSCCRSGHAVVADFGIARAMDADRRRAHHGVRCRARHRDVHEPRAGVRRHYRRAHRHLRTRLRPVRECSPVHRRSRGRRHRRCWRDTRSTPLPPIRTVRQTVGPALERVLERSLAKVPADRYPTAARAQGGAGRRGGGTGHDLENGAGQGACRARRPRPNTNARHCARHGCTRTDWRVCVAGHALTEPVTRRESHCRLSAHRPLGLPSQTLGEDIATVIGHALDGTGTLKWVDGWRLGRRGAARRSRLGGRVRHARSRARTRLRRVSDRATARDGHGFRGRVAAGARDDDRLDRSRP